MHTSGSRNDGLTSGLVGMRKGEWAGCRMAERTGELACRQAVNLQAEWRVGMRTGGRVVEPDGWLIGNHRKASRRVNRHADTGR